jgi:16S rRNA (adenine1518-N6/adenine1519-N6)-dimethyltransferase
MNLEEIQRLLLTHRINPNKLLGQNFMVDPAFYPKLITYAALASCDVVLDAGAGFGFLSRFLSDKCKGVVAVEKDPQVAAVLREHVKGFDNVTVVVGDILKAQLPPFNKVIAVPPYYLSSQLVTWVLMRQVDCAVMIVQKEFAERLVASVGSEEYGWLTVVAQQLAVAELLDAVPKSVFYPQPEVDSVILSLKSLGEKLFEVRDQAYFIRLVKWLFTERNKKLAKAVAPFLRGNNKLAKQAAIELAQTLPLHDMRVRELTPKDFGAIANALPN